MKGNVLCVTLFVFFFSCISLIVKGSHKPFNYEREMLLFLKEIRSYTPNDFIIIQQNATDLYYDGDTFKNIMYLNNIDGISQESVFYGDPKYGVATPADYTEFLVSALKRVKFSQKTILTTNYVSRKKRVAESNDLASEYGFINFNAPDRELSEIPPLTNVKYDVESLNDIKNVLYYINPAKFPTKKAMLKELTKTDYDILIIDAFFGMEPLNQKDIESLKIKANGGKRLVISYLSIGEAEDYRYYWQPEWSIKHPFWLGEENPDWEGNYRVLYWEKEWKKIIFNYIDIITASGYDGIFLDTVDTFNYFKYLND